ncbi:MAG TPA: MBL fold metallo-hydrolase [Hyphomicrobiaceae bacterium]|nr:MBL fold metallo-hydrolase [Hyphomicrobiaceae bacterium]
MSRRFDPQLVNGPFGDPGLYVDLIFERRALLFDLGDIGSLSPRKLLRVSDVFVTHRHMDHFTGFDDLLRCVFGREKGVSIYGPPGMIDAVEHKLKAYSWNLIGGYEGNPVFSVAEVDEEGRMARARFPGQRGFEREDKTEMTCEDGLMLRGSGFDVHCTTLDHGIPTLAFSLQERAHINVWRNKLEAMGLKVGPWLNTFKAAILRGDSDDTAIAVAWADGSKEMPGTMALGALKREIMRISAGRKIAYVVDARFTSANNAKVIALAKDADILFIEAAFLQADAALAAKRGHLTARQAGILAREADAKRLVTLHYSPRYQGRGEDLAREAEVAFRSG